MKRIVGTALAVVCAVCLPASRATARNIEEILQEKKLITPAEAKEAKSADPAKQVPAAPETPAAAPALSEKETASLTKTILDQVPQWVNKITPFGDVRVRNESFWQSGSPDRNRDRFRLRVGATVKVNDQTQVGFRLASGKASDPISNNQTFSDTFGFKSVNIAEAYLKFAPTTLIGLSRPIFTVMGGKFYNPMYAPASAPNMLQFDRDLAPEGGFENIKAIESKDGVIRGLGLNLSQFVFSENSASSEGALFGFQGLANLAFGNVLANVALGDSYYSKASWIGKARNSNSDLNITNNVTLSDGEIVGGKPVDPSKLGPNGDGKDANGKPITITGFVSDYNIVDLAGDVTVPTPWWDFPVNVFGDFAYNTAAKTSEDVGWQIGARVGRYADRNDMFLTYEYEQLQTDAVLSAFGDSDFGRSGGTNTKGHVIQAGYVVLKNLSLLSTLYIDKPIDSVPGRNGNTDYRWQVDAVAKF